MEGDARCPLREAAGSSHAKLVQAMSDLGSELRRLLAEQGMSLRDLARHVPCDSGNLSKIARGQKRPSPELAARLDEVLGAGGGLAALAPAVAPGVLGTDLDLIELARRAEASDLGSGTLGLLNAAVDGMCRDYPGADAAALSARAGQHLRYVTRLLSGRVTLAQHRELLVIAGWLSALIACTCYDTGDAMAARTACRMTQQFGSQAAHAVLVAWSFEIAAWFALVEGRYPETVALSEAGLEHAGGDLDEAISHGSAALPLPHRSAELLLRAGELCRAVADRHPGEHLVDKYGEELAVPSAPDPWVDHT